MSTVISPTVISPTVTTTTPAVTVTMPNMNYNQFLNSLGDYAYFVEKIYLASPSYRQITEVAQFNYLDANGNQRYISLTPTIDPYQSQPSLFYDVKDLNLVFNGNSQLLINLLANTKLQLSFYTKRIMKKELGTVDNFDELEKLEDRPDFFEDYEEVL